MPTLLVVHHTASPTLDEMLESVLLGARDDEIEGVDVVTAAALTASPAQVLAADGLVLGTPANMGYMSGAMKVFFDNAYYPCLREKRGLPYGLYVHGNNDVTGAVSSVERLAAGLGWRRAAPVVEVVGQPSAADFQRLRELGGVVAATLMM
ncbi:MAG: flavodoxin family protein [Actinomycetes bacterium]